MTDIELTDEDIQRYRDAAANVYYVVGVKEGVYLNEFIVALCDEIMTLRTLNCDQGKHLAERHEKRYARNNFYVDLLKRIRCLYHGDPPRTAGVDLSDALSDLMPEIDKAVDGW